jgi:SAM-dependent methyltransferase
MKLHLGCGPKRLPGYTHVDMSPEVQPDVVANADDLRMFQDASVDLVYASHLLEHFLLSRVDVVLAEWRRVLKPAGLLRVAVPDMDSMCRAITKGASLRFFRGAIWGGQDHLLNIHYSGWTSELLTAKLHQSGFCQVVHWDPAVVHPEGFRDYSSYRIRTTVGIIPVSLNLQARKQS